MNAELFWKMVKREVARQKTSYEWLYRKTGIPKGTFSSWKNRNIIPRADEASRIAQALDVSVEYLLSGHDRTGKVSNPDLKAVIEALVSLDDTDVKAVKALVQAMSERYVS